MGIDIVDLDEFRSGPAAEDSGRFFLSGEVEYARTQARSWESLAARLAAKRAVMRALGVASCVAGGDGSSDELLAAPAWHEVEILRQESGEVDVRLRRGALAAARSLGVSACSLSISHTRRTAIAVAILEDGRP